MKLTVTGMIKRGCRLIALAALAACITLMFATEVKAANLHTVTFVYGAKVRSEQVAHGMNASIPRDINQDGYNFLGWFGNAICVTEDRVILGVYEPKTADEKWTVNPTESVPDSSFPINTYGVGPYKQDPTIKFNDAISAPEPEWWKELNIPKGVPGVTCAVRWYNGCTGELWKTDIVPYGYTCKDPGNPCIKGTIFIGWEGSWENVTEDRNIRAWYITDQIYCDSGDGSD